LTKEGDHEVVEDLPVEWESDTQEWDDSETLMDSHVADAPQNDEWDGDNPSVTDMTAPLTGSETPEDDLPLCEERGTACGGEVDSDTQDSLASASEWQTWEASEWQDEVDSGTGESTAIDTLKDIIESETENLSWDVESLTWEILTGNIENLTWTALELSQARETLNTDPIEKSETYNKVTVNVLAPVNTFPEGTKLVIEAIKWDALEEVRQQISDEPTNNVDEDAEIVAFDIRFEYELSDGSIVELQPKENTVQVTFDYSKNKELKKADQNDSQEIEIYHINDKDDNGEKVESWAEVVEKIEINEEKSEEVDNALVVDAESFSVYAVTVNSNSYNIILSDTYKTTTLQWNWWDTMNNFTYGTITIPRAWHDDIIIMDRNLWATDRWNASDAVWNNSSYTAPTTYWYQYQWWNKYGFSQTVTPSTDNSQVTRTSNSYSNSTFIIDNAVWYDNATDSDDWTQWPCPSGRHLPSSQEWQNVYTALNAWSDGQWFAEALLLPPTGFRDYYSEYVDSVQSVGTIGEYWSLSPYDDMRAYSFHFKSSQIIPQSDFDRSYGFSVRCFKDEYEMPSFTVTYNLSGWYWTESWTTYTQSRQITYNPDDSWNYIVWSLTSRKTPSKAEWTCDWKKCMFDGWYLTW
jgi:uncharacterized protein (TIGR02145 family)